MSQAASKNSLNFQLKNKKDLYLILLTLLHITIIVGTAAAFPKIMAMPLYLSIPLCLFLCFVNVFICLTNYQCISHYHIHLPFFVSDKMNYLFSVINTLSLGVPQTLYDIHHTYHHRGNNDKVNPATGTTVDYASSYRYSKNPDEEEAFLPYILKSVIRGEISPLYKKAVAQKRGTQTHIEFVFMFSMWAVIYYINAPYFFLFYLPTWYLGQMANYAENYLEHHKARATNRMTDSVSCYNPFYNWIWFNNGLHQEHHYRPMVHWAALPTVTALLVPVNERRTVKYCHLFNLFDWATMGPSADTEKESLKNEAQASL